MLVTSLYHHLIILSLVASNIALECILCGCHDVFLLTGHEQRLTERIVNPAAQQLRRRVMSMLKAFVINMIKCDGLLPHMRYTHCPPLSLVDHD